MRTKITLSELQGPPASRRPSKQPLAGRMPALSVFLLGLLLATSPLTAATTINAVNHFSYGANIGWIDWRGDVANGAIVGAFVCSGSIWSANTGWIQLGDGTPVDGIRYQNNSGSDFGVNHDGVGNLIGYAWGANIGWLNFTNRDATGASFEGPKVSLVTGKLSGFVWSANCGWISLSNQFAHVQIDTLDCGPDLDGDGIPDAWELQYAANLSVLGANSDHDGDGLTDSEEFLADTNPTNASSHLRLTLVSAPVGGVPTTLTWTSSPTRQYRVRFSADVGAPLPWADAGPGLITPSNGATTSQMVPGVSVPHRFFVIEALKPLP